MSEPPRGFLDGIRVLELADERGEFAGKMLASLGADVIKVEPPAGSRSRAIGPFYRDVPDRERSLFFWHYNTGERGIVLDLETRSWPRPTWFSSHSRRASLRRSASTTPIFETLIRA